MHFYLQCVVVVQNTVCETTFSQSGHVLVECKQYHHTPLTPAVLSLKQKSKCGHTNVCFKEEHFAYDLVMNTMQKSTISLDVQK